MSLTPVERRGLLILLRPYFRRRARLEQRIEEGRRRRARLEQRIEEGPRKRPEPRPAQRRVIELSSPRLVDRVHDRHIRELAR